MLTASTDASIRAHDGEIQTAAKTLQWEGSKARRKTGRKLSIHTYF